MRKEERVGESVTVKGNVLEIFLFNFFFWAVSYGLFGLFKDWSEDGNASLDFLIYLPTPGISYTC